MQNMYEKDKIGSGNNSIALKIFEMPCIRAWKAEALFSEITDLQFRDLVGGTHVRIPTAALEEGQTDSLLFPGY